MEDQFLTFDVMQKVSEDLTKAGFQHVVARHYIDPQWRKSARPNRPELEPVAWTVGWVDYLIPLPKIKALIEICERHELTCWWGADCTDDGHRLYLKVGRGDGVANRFITPNSGAEVK